ncbi:MULTISPECIES: DNA primase [unclassified Sedimentibacter]|uniref:DNA primase n=1 Tax=unclassified Sedimentibacter TaxID=2649220 RepID=UPI0027DFEFD3|nr:DNA primase [Sedimentibacter sp. MB35-C1]WMJ76254.1 DNA primase [Sedimentibacter sp. MB35-C1]
MPYKLDSDVIKRILDENNIVDVIEEFLPLKKAGSNYNTNCPFHKEKTPSFIVSPEKQMFHCFGCGESGDSISFLTKYKNFTFVEAAEYLARKAGIVLEETNSYSKNNESRQLAERLYKINRDAALYFFENMKSSPQVIKYLKSRKIDVPVIKKFGIGYAINQWDNLLKYLTHKGYIEEEILKTGLIIKSKNYNSYYDRFRNRVMFPIFDLKDRIIGFGGRVLDDSLPKYLNSPETQIFNKGYNLYGLNLARGNVRDKHFILVEGYMDVIKMHSYGYNNTVAALGTSLTNNQIKLMKRYSKNFYVTFDSDSAGQKAALKAMNMFKQNNLDAKVVIMQDAKDPDEYLNKFGKIKFDKLLENSLDYYSFLELHYKEVFENSNKVEYINKFFDNIVYVNSEIEKELIFEKLSRKVGVSKESIIKEFNKKNNRKETFVKAAQPARHLPQVNKITTSHEEKLIKLILLNNDFALQLKEIVNEATFTDLEYYNIFREMYEYRINDMSIDEESLNNIIKNKEDVKVLLQYDDVDYDNLEALFKDCIKRLKIKYYENKKTLLTEALSQSENTSKSGEIMNEIFSLAKKIKSTKEEVN